MGEKLESSKKERNGLKEAKCHLVGDFLVSD